MDGTDYLPQMPRVDCVARERRAVDPDVGGPRSRAPAAGRGFAAACGAVAVGALGAWTVVLALAGAPSPLPRALAVARVVSTALAVAAFAGGFALRQRSGVAARDRVRAEQLALAERAWRHEQAAGLSALSRLVAHELRNPVHGIALHARAIQGVAARLGGDDAARLQRSGDDIRAECARLERLVGEYLAHAGGPQDALVRQPTTLPALVARVVARLGVTLAARNVEVELAVDGAPPPVAVDPVLVERAVENLVRESVDALGGRGGLVRIEVRAAGEHVQVTVSDDGPGFTDPTAMFRPFRGTRRGGPGLGLAVVRDIARAHGGDVAARGGADGRGVAVVLRLPARC